MTTTAPPPEPARAWLPRLYVVTNDGIVARADFAETAGAIMRAGGARVAFQLRAKRASATALYDHAAALAPIARAAGAVLFVNERYDVALAAGANGVQLNARSVPVAAAAAAAAAAAGAAPERLLIGYSAHAAAEARQAEADGADLVVLGTIWASASHPGECTAGVEVLARVAETVAAPVYAIGGVTPVRAQEAMLAGAHGVAVISGVWNDSDPVRAVETYLEAMQVVHD